MPIFVSMNKIILKRKVGSRVLNGHPWIFANEIGEIKGAGDVLLIVLFKVQSDNINFITFRGEPVEVIVKIRARVRDADTFPHVKGLFCRANKSRCG